MTATSSSAASTSDTSARRRALLASVVELYWPLAAAMLMAAVGYATPAGAAGYTVATNVLVGVLFLVLGLTLNLEELRKGSLAWRFHLLLQGFSLVLSPSLYYFAVYRWGWEVSSGILTRPLAVGCMAACCMPTTAATSLVFVLQAGGDASVSAFNMAFAQTAGVLVAPLSVSLLVGGSGSSNVPKALWKMSYRILMPLVGGVLLQLLAIRAIGAVRARRTLRRLKPLNIVCLVVLFYFIFVKAFADSRGLLTAVGMLKLLAWIACVHIVLLGAAWVAASHLLPARRVAFVLVAPQKTEGLALAVLSSLFPSSSSMPIGELALPVIAYHSVQMVVASVVVPLLRWRFGAELAQPRSEVDVDRTALVGDGGRGDGELVSVN
mmetsp:Transcript_6146/g.16069  ORF Transcript_6146/g.16069 Transcript_6146/m.16069 type:complete len:380 (+) Transcript_6146:176-1315(+)